MSRRIIPSAFPICTSGNCQTGLIGSASSSGMESESGELHRYLSAISGAWCPMDGAHGRKSTR
jgi:hypothetical protein